jgi:DNA invertase Pin-like site-specific DNA recombinase
MVDRLMPGPYRIVSEIDARRMRTAHEMGETIASIAKRYNVSVSTARRSIQRASGTTSKGISEESAHQLRSLYESGWTLRKLAEMYKIDKQNVARNIEKVGGTLRPRGRPPQCDPDCDPGGNSEDHAKHSTHQTCAVCPYHTPPRRQTGEQS